METPTVFRQHNKSHKTDSERINKNQREAKAVDTLIPVTKKVDSTMKYSRLLYAAASCSCFLSNQHLNVSAFTARQSAAVWKMRSRSNGKSGQHTLLLKSTSIKDEVIMDMNSTGAPFSMKLASELDKMSLIAPVTKGVGTVDFTISSAENSNWLEPLMWRGVILILCALWASNFAAAKLVMAEPGVDSSLYALARFGVAATALAPGAIGAAKRANMDWDTIRGAAICGSWVAMGYLGQTLGLLTTTASKSCVICSMHCVFVAIIAELWRVQRSQTETKFDLSRLLPAALAVVGVAIVELKGAGGAPTIGDALSFAQPIGFGMGYLQLEELMKKNPEAALPVSALKLSVVALASLGMFELSPLTHGMNDFAFRIPDFAPILSSPLALGGILYTGLVTTAFALWIESIAFAKVPATDASIILTTEPLIAAGFGAIALGETFGASDYAGAALIVGACALAVLLQAPHQTVDPIDCVPDVNETCAAGEDEMYQPLGRL